MNFFIDDEHWDIEGYWKQIKTLESRLSKRSFRFFSTHSFHDAYFISLNIRNTYRLLKRRQADPTSIEAKIVDYMDDYEYIIIWREVTKVCFSFDEKDKIFVDEEGKEYFGGVNLKGIDSWGYDELTILNDVYLSHEILFHSGARLLIHFKSLDYKRSLKKIHLRY